MKKGISILSVSIIFVSIILFTACQRNNLLNPKKPIILNVWHNYGGQMKNTMDEMIDEFNDTVGLEKGIILNVTSISGSKTLHEKLVMAANDDPNAPELPDITTAYPNTALLLAEKGLLADIEIQFTQDELSLYVPRFIDEGRLKDNHLYVFPVAKSTEVMFVNETIFNRFMRENNVSYENLKTFEGINKTAKIYYDWTDNLTPDIKNDGKAFIVYDSLFNMAQVSYSQLGDSFIKNNKLDYSSPVFKKIWDIIYKPSVQGYTAIFDGYGSDLAKTGDVVCSIGSTAGVLFYPPTVTYADNVVESVEYIILPYPTIEGGKKVAIQRGSGICVTKSTKEKEYAAGIFLKWFTEPEQNLRFISSTGYLPVTNDAFNKIMTEDNKYVSDKNIKKLLTATKLMHNEYDFYIPPIFDKFDEIQKQYDKRLKQAATESKKIYFELLNETEDTSAFEESSENAFLVFIK